MSQPVLRRAAAPASTKKLKTAAVVTIVAPGNMTEKGRAEIAKWLRNQARNLVRYGNKYRTDGRYIGRWQYS